MIKQYSLGMICAVLAGLTFAMPATADIYAGDAGAFDFTISAGTTGPTFEINTDTGITNPATVTGGLDAGVMVFRFNNLTVANDVTVTVTGSNPLAIAAAGDVTWAADISVANGIAGGGAGGAVGTGGSTGGSGGSGGVGLGAGGTRRNGGTAGPGGSGGAGGPGEARAPGNNGASGGAGAAGEAGQQGGDGTAGFGAVGTPGSGGPGGNAGTSSGVDTNRGLAASGGGGNGTGGGGATNNNASPGNPATATGNTAGSGSFGLNGGNGGDGFPGTNAVFTASASDLTLVAGHGGGGGGGGGQGGGGQGGGQGGGGSSGAGGGGGGGMNGTDCNSSDAAGGVGGQGGAGGTGGTGGVGGSAPAAGDGGLGASGGGAIVLAAKGLMNFTGEVNISAGPNGTGSPGDFGVAGVAGDPGGTAEVDTGFTAGGGSSSALSGSCGGAVAFQCNVLFTCSTTSFNSGAGGAGSLGGDGGSGGQGATSGSSGGGGNGGFGTPGMAKLMGSVVLASGGTVRADNIAGVATSQNGKFTLISNMRAADIATNQPSLTQASTETGSTTNNTILTGPAVYDAGTTLPVIPQLAGDIDTHGVLQGSFYNDGVSRTNVETTPNAEITRIADANTVFDGFDQIFVENTSGSTLVGQGLIIGAFAPIVLPDLGAGEIWTTHVAPGASVTGVNSLTIDTQPVGGDIYEGDGISLTVAASGGNPTVSYQWRKDGVDILIGDNATAQSATLNITGAVLADTGLYSCVVTDDGALAAPATSNAVQVNVFAHLAATIQPEGGVRFSSPPDTFTFYFGTTGGFQSVNYAWTKDSTPVQSGPSPVLFISPVTQADAGVYECTATDLGTDTVVSSTATLVVDPLGITQQPENTLVVAGDEARLEVGVEGGVGTVTYQWFEEDGSKAEVAVPGATTDTLVFNPSVLGDSGLYFCRVSDNTSSIDSAQASIVVASPLQIIGQPASVTTNEGSTVSFAVTTTGGQGPISYTWKFDGNPIASAPNSAVYTINAASVSDAGLYSVDVVDNIDTLNSTSASLVVESSVPAADYRGLALLMVVCLGAGALLLRRSRRRTA